MCVVKKIYENFVSKLEHWEQLCCYQYDVEPDCVDKREHEIWMKDMNIEWQVLKKAFDNLPTESLEWLYYDKKIQQIYNDYLTSCFFTWV